MITDLPTAPPPLHTPTNEQDKFDPKAPLLDLEKEALKGDFNLLNLATTGE